MKIYKHIFCFYILLSHLYCEVKTLTWQQVVKIAKEKNPQLQQAVINLQQTKIKLENVKSEFYPQVSLGMSSGKSLRQNYESELSYSYNLSAGVTLFSGFSRLNNLRIQLIELQVVHENYKRTLANLIASLKESFINVYYAQETVKLSTKILNRRKQNYELVKLKYESGREDLGSLLRVEADMLQANYELNRATRALEMAVRTLFKTMGEDKFEFVKVDNIDFSNDVVLENLLSKDVSEIISQTPEYKISELQLQKIKLQARNYSSVFYPTILASAGLSWSGNEVIPDFDKWNLSLSMRLSYTIFNGFKNINDLKIANNNIRTAEFDFYNTKLNLVNNFLNLKTSFIDNKEQATVREKYLQALEKQAEIISIKYANGLATYYDWYQTEDSLVNAQRSLLNLQREISLSKISIEKFLAYTE